MNTNTLIISLSFLLLFPFSKNVEDNICRDDYSEHTLQMMGVLLSGANETFPIQGGYQHLTMDDITRLSWPELEAECSQLAEKEYYYDSDLDIEVSYFKSSNRYFLVTFFKDTLPSEDGLTFMAAPSAAILVLDENFEVVHGIFL